MQEVHEALNFLVERKPISSSDGENLVLINDTGKNIVVFRTLESFQFICEMENGYIDGTFDCCMQHFKQLFRIHGEKNQNYLPLAFWLLPNKE